MYDNEFFFNYEFVLQNKYITKMLKLFNTNMDISEISSTQENFKLTTRFMIDF
jgi:hypothetical protein